MESWSRGRRSGVLIEMVKIEPAWDWDEEYQTNIRSCPEGYTFVGGYRNRKGKYISNHCRKLKPGEKSRIVEHVHKKENHWKKLNNEIYRKR